MVSAKIQKTFHAIDNLRDLLEIVKRKLINKNRESKQYVTSNISGPKITEPTWKHLTYLFENIKSFKADSSKRFAS